MSRSTGRFGWLSFLAVPVFLIPLLHAHASQQQPSSAQQSPASAAPAPSSSSSSSQNAANHTHATDFLIRGSVFNPQSLAFPGVKLRVRRSSDKKFRWETYTNSRGEFAIRVPQGAEYEIVLSAKGFREQNHAVDAKSGFIQDGMTFRMEPLSGGQK